VAFQYLRDDPLYWDHSPLVLRWDNDQIEQLVDVLLPHLVGETTDEMRLAIAAVARSIVTEHTITGAGVHYARAKAPYSRPKRYRDGDPRFSWWFVTKAMDALKGAGLIDHTVGRLYPHHTGRQSVAYPTDTLMALILPLIDVSEPRGIFKWVETIVLRDLDDKADVDYDDTADTEAMRQQVQRLNDDLKELVLLDQRQKITIPLGRRVFNGSFERGGRFYCHGSSYQNMPATQRRELEFVTDGAAPPMVEVDYCNLHITMAYAEAGETIPAGDQYQSDGFPRGLVKVAVNTLFNAATVNSGILAVTEELRDDPALRAVCGIESSDRSLCRPLAKAVVTAIQGKHHRIEDYFGSDCGARFQRADSDMAINVMTRMVENTGRCPLSVHDSFLVPEMDADVLSETMIEVARDSGIHARLKSSRDM